MSPIEELGLIRVDDRLIHGQVVVAWCRYRGFSRVVVVDDAMAADTFMQEVLHYAAPPNVRVEVWSVEQAIAGLNLDRPDRATTMVLLKSPRVAQQLYDGGVSYRGLNVGGIGGGPGRRNIFRNIAVSPDDVAVLKDLLGKGVKITLLTVPGEKAKDFAEMVGRL